MKVRYRKLNQASDHTESDEESELLGAGESQSFSHRWAIYRNYYFYKMVLQKGRVLIWIRNCERKKSPDLHKINEDPHLLFIQTYSLLILRGSLFFSFQFNFGNEPKTV